MITLRVLVLLITAAVIQAAPLASIHVKFVSPPHSYEHGITTHGAKSTTPPETRQFHRSFPAERSLRQRIVTPDNAEALWPIGVFLPPVDINDLGISSHDHLTPDFSDGLEHPDPLLLTGDDAALAVKYIYGRGELFFADYPHVRALLNKQEERRVNGLHGHLLSSLRPESPFYRKAGKFGQ